MRRPNIAFQWRLAETRSVLRHIQTALQFDQRGALKSTLPYRGAAVVARCAGRYQRPSATSADTAPSPLGPRTAELDLTNIRPTAFVDNSVSKLVAGLVARQTSRRASQLCVRRTELLDDRGKVVPGVAEVDLQREITRAFVHDAQRSPRFSWPRHVEDGQAPIHNDFVTSFKIIHLLIGTSVGASIPSVAFIA